MKPAPTLEKPSYDLRALQRAAMLAAHKRCPTQPQSVFERYYAEEFDKLLAFHEETQR